MMTTLRDDGYLSTDDPVVAACFLGRDVKSEALTVPDGTYRRAPNGEWWGITLDGVYSDFAIWMCGPYSYPILIPAATVAEVALPDVNYRLYQLITYSVPEQRLDNWIHQHTEEATGE